MLHFWLSVRVGGEWVEGGWVVVEGGLNGEVCEIGGVRVGVVGLVDDEGLGLKVFGGWGRSATQAVVAIMFSCREECLVEVQDVSVSRM